MGNEQMHYLRSLAYAEEIKNTEIQEALLNAADTIEQFQENENLLEFLFDIINPNEMEQYLSIYKAAKECPEEGKLKRNN